MNRFRCSFSLLLLSLIAAGAHAQSGQPTHVTLGPSVVPLYGPWKFTVGDSPIDPATNTPLWAQPAFDDSKWETVDLTPKGLLDPLGGFSDYVKGWTARGHAGYSGYAWYRIRVQVAAQPGEKLALSGPPYVDDAYQLFSDGTLIGSFGKFSGRQPTFYFTQPMMFDLPATGAQSPSSVRVLAFRLWMAPDTMVTQADTGGLHTAPLLGDAGAVSAGYQLRWLEPIRSHVADVVEGLLYLLLAMVAFSLTRFDRSDPVYVWMGSIFVLLVINNILIVVAAWSQVLSANTDVLVQDGFITPLLLGAWVMVWWVWFRLQRPAWVPGAVAVLTLAFMVSTIIGRGPAVPIHIDSGGGRLPHHLSRSAACAADRFDSDRGLGHSPPGCGGLAGSAGRRAPDCFAVYGGASPSAYKG